MRLGRKPHDPLRLARAPMVRHFAAMPPPAPLDRSSLGFVPLMAGNDILPNCTAASLLNHMRAVSKLNGYELVCDQTMAQPFYAGCIGEPDDAVVLAGTDGAVVLDVLGYLGSHGYPIGQQVPFSGDWAVIPTDRVSLANGVLQMVGWWGVDLYEADMEMPAIWDDTGVDKGKLVGGHQILVWDFPTGLADDDLVTIMTWSAPQAASWRWVASRIQEAFGIVWRQLAKPDGSNWRGLDTAGMIAEARRIGQVTT